jgi:hypothetical protein
VMGFESAFLPYQEKVAFVEQIREEIGALNGRAHGGHGENGEHGEGLRRQSEP